MNPINRIVIKGDQGIGRNFIGEANSQMNILLNQMSFQKLNQGVREVQPSPGVIIRCRKTFNYQECLIYVAPTSDPVRYHYWLFDMHDMHEYTFEGGSPPVSGSISDLTLDPPIRGILDYVPPADPSICWVDHPDRPEAIAPNTGGSLGGWLIPNPDSDFYPKLLDPPLYYYLHAASSENIRNPDQSGISSTVEGNQFIWPKQAFYYIPDYKAAYAFVLLDLDLHAGPQPSGGESLHAYASVNVRLQYEFVGEVGYWSRFYDFVVSVRDGASVATDGPQLYYWKLPYYTVTGPVGLLEMFYVRITATTRYTGSEAKVTIYALGFTADPAPLDDGTVNDPDLSFTGYPSHDVSNDLYYDGDIYRDQTNLPGRVVSD